MAWEKQAFVNGETSSFLMKHNQPARIRAVFPSTTPAALTTLATASWPGRHGMPGWNLRDKSGVDFPGNSDSGGPTVQLLALSDRIKDARSGVSTQKLGFDTWDKVFVEIPWSRRILDRSDQSRETKKQSNTIRKMIYINAYNGDDYQNWSQGSKSEGTNFSSWQMGNLATRDDNASPFDTAKIEETAYDTLGEPEGATNAINFFRNGLDGALSKIAEAERKDESTFTYLYTAHPDKHMHALGVEHPKVQQVIRGIDSEIERFWNLLSDRNALLTRFDKNDGTNHESKRAKMTPKSIDASVGVTADHGHITVDPKHMILLPSDVLDCLEYANIGVHGKVSRMDGIVFTSNLSTSMITPDAMCFLEHVQGRHGYLHCRSGLQSILLRRWNSHNTLLEHFIILTVDEAISNGLFGPQSMRQEVRPRLGDFVVISKGKHTLVTPNEAETYQNTCRCQGAHGSLLPEEMMIPFILLERR